MKDLQSSILSKKINNDFGTFFCGIYVANDFLEITNKKK